MTIEYTTIKIPKDLAEAVDQALPHLFYGYRNRTEFIVDSIRNKLHKVCNLSKIDLWEIQKNLAKDQSIDSLVQFLSSRGILKPQFMYQRREYEAATPLDLNDHEGLSILKEFYEPPIETNGNLYSILVQTKDGVDKILFSHLREEELQDIKTAIELFFQFQMTKEPLESPNKLVFEEED